MMRHLSELTRSGRGLPESWDPGVGKSTSAATADSPRAEVRQKQR